MTLFTVGHGTKTTDEFTNLLKRNSIDALVDVRSFPGSRLSPHFGRERMEKWIPSAGVSYQWKEILGGFRKTLKDSQNLGLRHKSFRGYGDYMSTVEFDDGMRGLISSSKESRIAIMCSESCWWKCHRRLISDAATLIYGVDVQHIMERGLSPHKLTDTAINYDKYVKYPLPMLEG